MPCSAVESSLHGPIQEESLSKGPKGCLGTTTEVEETASSLALLLWENNPDASAPGLKSLHPSSGMSPQEWTPETLSTTEEQLRPHQGPSEPAWDRLRSHGNVSTVKEDKPSDTLQMSLSEGWTFLSEEETHTLAHRLHGFSAQKHRDESREAQQAAANVCETPKTPFVHYTKDLIEIDSLDLVFKSSEPGGQSENLDYFLQDREGLVYWAEPVQVSNPNPLLEEAVGGVCGIEPFVPPPGTPTPSSSPSAETDHPPAKDVPPFLSSSHGFSQQMSLPLASHITHRKDIPYETNSQCSRLPNVLRLDTSTPYRAVQSWTDLQIRRNILTQMFMQGVFPTISNKATASKSVPEGAPSQKPTPHGLTWTTRNKCSLSQSVIRALLPDEEVHTPGSEGETLGNHRLVNVTCSCGCCCRARDSTNTRQAHVRSPVSSSHF